MGLDRQCHTRAEGAGQLPILSGAGLLHCPYEIQTKLLVNKSSLPKPGPRLRSAGVIEVV